MSNRDFDRGRSGDLDRERRRSSTRPVRRPDYWGESDYGREGWTGFGAEGDWEGGTGREGGYATYGREAGAGHRPESRRRGGFPSPDYGEEERFPVGYEGRRERRSPGTGARGEDYTSREDYIRRPDYGRGDEEEYGRPFGYSQEHPEWGHYGGRGYWQDYGWGSRWPQGRSHEGYGWEQEEAAHPRGPGRTTYGPHYGRGPKGYQRSDDRIREDINDHLTEHPEIDATDIEVHVENGEVYLRGSVEDRRMKRLSEDMADGISGVRDVHNELRVRQREERRAA